ncbi:protein HOTHEAD-like isoform X1 [Gossypium australe]|uniref:Protein HOTHEAD-like isoform X1 n=1 Tax=Gossypium australe TaxID=47621 RepID=A0A5B6UP03_9ROSI|nr:protein HOTHEAD-like isoform X1 [Gossypium australe]
MCDSSLPLCPRPHTSRPKIRAVGSRPRTIGVIYEDALGVKHTAYLTNDSKSEIIVLAGTIGSS